MERNPRPQEYYKALKDPTIDNETLMEISFTSGVIDVGDQHLAKTDPNKLRPISGGSVGALMAPERTTSPTTPLPPREGAPRPIRIVDSAKNKAIEVFKRTEDPIHTDERDGVLFQKFPSGISTTTSLRNYGSKLKP